MAKYIEKNFTKDHLQLESDCGYIKTLEDVFKVIDAIPSVDAVEVVRCEKCRFGHYLSGVKKYECHNPLYAERNTHRGQHFCSYGNQEKRQCSFIAKKKVAMKNM